MSIIRARCLHDFKARQRDELSLRKGELVQVLRGPGGCDDWLLVTADKGQFERKGLVPHNYVEILPAEDTAVLLGTPHLIRDFDSCSDWRSAKDEESGDVYYYNHFTGESQWELPSELRPQDLKNVPLGFVDSSSENEALGGDVSRMTALSIDASIQSIVHKDQQAVSVEDATSPIGFNIHTFQSCREPSGSADDAILHIEKILKDMQNDDIGEGKFPHVARGSVRSPAATYAPQETASDVFLPPIQASASVNHTSPSSSTPCVHVPQLIAEVPQSHCRPKLYPPSTYDATEPTQLKSNGLRLEQSYCFGYSGELKKLTAPTGSCRALGGSVSRNIFWLSNSIIMYPSAALVVLLATSGAHETKQCLFNGHTEEVTAVTIFPTGHTAASGQSGKYPRVIVWKYEGHMRALQCGEQCEAKRCIILDINLDVSYRGVNNLSFSSDGNFLVVVASDDNHTLLLYEMTASSAEKHTPVLSLKLGHAEVLNFCFNYYQFSPFSWTAAAQSIIPGNSNSPMKSRSENGNHIARNNVIKGEQSFCDTNKAWELAEGCYTLFSCMSRSLKLWTLYKYKELADPGVVEVSGFKGRRMSMPKHMQQWITRYHLRGFLCPLPKSSAPFEVTSCCAVSDAAEEIKSTNTRFFCGTTSGCIIVWRQTEVTKIDEITSMLSPASRSKALSKKPSMNCPQTKCWLPKGQFLYVITDVHDGSIYDIDVSKQFDLDQTLYTCGRDCVVNMWKILPAVGAQDRNQIPIQHLKSIPFNWKRGDEKVGDSRDKDPAEALLNEPLEGIGRFIAISPDDTVAIIGLSSNGLYRVRCPGFSLSNTTLTASNITVDAIMLGHSGSILRVVQHPVSDIFVTLATDRSVRVWSLSKKQQLSTTYIRDDSLSSICFSPNGKHIAVGTATYGNVLFFDLNFENGKASPENYKIDAVDLILVRRKKVFSKRHKPKKPDKLDHENMVSNDCHVPEVIDREAAIVARNIQRLPGKKDAEIVDVCYSPDSTVLAVACKNGSIYLLSAEENYKRYAVCQTDNKLILRINFSKDGSVILVNDSAMLLSYWNSDTGIQLLNTKHLRDLQWSSWNSSCGWPVQGIHNHSDGSDGSYEHTIAACRSHNELLIAVGTDNYIGESVKIFEYPALGGSIPAVNRGHSATVNDLCFSSDDSSVISCGSFNDSSIIVWQVIL